MTPIPSAYHETEPITRLLRCSVEGCRKGVHARGLCSMHYQRWRLTGSTKGPERNRRCSVPECGNAHYGKGLCRNHWRRWKETGNPLVEPESPFYADLPCPACGDRRTVPFDPRPELAGRPPSSGLGTCCACGHTWVVSPSASSLPVNDQLPPTGAGRDDGDGGRRRPQTRNPRRVPAPASAVSRTAQPGRANSRAGDAPAVTGTTGAA